ncbi:MAG TPA: thiamine phosphate synthase [Beijerinckiaceae bacterium]|jgi:thiamine-phosphate pyrophosphorylase
MPEPAARLYLITPLLAEVDSFAPRLRAACAAGDVAAVLVRLELADERTLVNRVKALAPAAQDNGTAVIIAAEGEADLTTIAVRGGADGVHVGGDAAEARRARERLKDERIVGAGNIRSKHDAMGAGEAGVDYVLFGEPRDDGSVPPLAAVIERAAWWAEIFETPCVAYAPSLDAVSQLVATGAEFVALGDAVWTHAEGPAAAVAAALGCCGAKAGG